MKMAEFIKVFLKSKVGGFKDDKKNGQGELSYPDGKKYIGGWKNGKMHGRGAMIDRSGNKTEGNWSKGKKL